MKKTAFITILVLLSLSSIVAQPLYRFNVKVGIDCQSVDSLGGIDNVKKNITKMFERINKAFNYSRQFKAIYDFSVDWNAFYIYNGISTEEVYKPHPKHDYLVVIDGYKSDPKEVGGGWYGSDILTVYHARTHNNRFNDPFNDQAIDGIIHEFGHGRGVPDIYAMNVDANKNHIAHIGYAGEKCIMNYPYGEKHWSDYAVNMINLSEDKMVEIDNLVAEMLPNNIEISVSDAENNPVKDADVYFYPVNWYSNEVSSKAILNIKTRKDGSCILKGESLFPKNDEFGLKYSNMFIKVTYKGMNAYGWLPLHEIENVTFKGEDTYKLMLKLKDSKPSNPFDFKINNHIYHAPSMKEKSRWELSDSSTIVWHVNEESVPHSDHIEMSGEQMAFVLRWAIDKNTTLTTERSLVFPMLRKIPNNTHASLMHRISIDVASLVSVDGLALKNGKTELVEINGMFKSVDTWSVGKQNIGTGSGTNPIPAVKLERIVFPSMDKPIMCEHYKLTNIRERDAIVYIPELSQTYKTLPEKGVEGEYLINAHIQGYGTFILKKGESVTFDLILSGRRASEPLITPNVTEELNTRMKFIENDINDKLVLKTPDPILNIMFRYAKIRTSESIFKTSGGYMHAPGGESYYAAIWANDQAEYVNPFFPYLGYWRGNESAINSFRQFAKFMNPEYNPIPSSIIAEGKDIWNGAGDRGDAAMIAYGASNFALAYADKKIAEELWPLIQWCLEYCNRKINKDGVVTSDTDELEGRFESGNANLCTSSLYYGALQNTANLSRELEKPVSVTRNYITKADELKKNLEKYYGANVSGFDTYQYYYGNNILRSWICMPLTVGIFDRAEATVNALCSPLLWQKDGLLTEQGSSTFWDRSTLYALRGIYAAGKADIATEKLQSYSKRRLIGNHVPYAIEAWPEGSQRHLSAESGLYCRIITEGLFGIKPTGFHSFNLTPSMPSSWNEMSLSKIEAFGGDIDIMIKRIKNDKLLVNVKSKNIIKKYIITKGKTINVKL